MSPQFAKLYSSLGRLSIAPGRLLRSLLLQIFDSVSSEQMLIEQSQYNLLFRWFVGMETDEEVWNHAVLSKNRERLLNEEVAEVFFVCRLTAFLVRYSMVRSQHTGQFNKFSGAAPESWEILLHLRAKGRRRK